MDESQKELAKAIKLAGGPVALSRSIGLSKMAVTLAQRRKSVSAKMAVRIKKTYPSINLDRLCPDLKGFAPKA